MKQHIPAKSNAKSNILFKRKLKIYVDRCWFTIQMLTLCFIGLLLFTNYLDSIKRYTISCFVEYSADVGLVLENVLVAGHHNLQSSDVVSYINADVGTAILSINLDDARSALEQNDWVQDAVVERRLPNTIYINISERDPIAIWQHNQKLQLVDMNAHVIHTDNIEKFAGLLHVVGSDAHLHAGSLQRNLQFDPQLAQKIISAVRYGERRWNIILDQGITVKMPQDQEFIGAFEYLSKLNNAAKLFNHRYKTIDLRDKAKYYFEQYPDELSK